MEKQLIEGYKYSAKNDSQLISDFAHVDLENWDDEYSEAKKLKPIVNNNRYYSGSSENDFKKPCKTTAK